MVARVIHFGADTCHRLPVIRSAGYRVETCNSISELRDALAAEEETDAVLISEGTGGVHQDAVLLARSHSEAPIILFRKSQRSFSESEFDLVVPVLDPPESWLAGIANLIARRQELRAKSELLRGRSVELRVESGLAHAKSSSGRKRVRRAYSGRTIRRSTA